MDRFVYIGASVDRQQVWELEHEGDYQTGDKVIRIGITDHGSISVDIKDAE
jgi:hypothetical protein